MYKVNHQFKHQDLSLRVWIQWLACMGKHTKTWNQKSIFCDLWYLFCYCDWGEISTTIG